jgi:hypothetical protein
MSRERAAGTEVAQSAKLDAALGRQAGVALDHTILNLDGAAHRVNDAAELYDASVARALHHAPVVHGGGCIDQIASERAQHEPVSVHRQLRLGVQNLDIENSHSENDCRRSGCGVNPQPKVLDRDHSTLS